MNQSTRWNENLDFLVHETIKLILYRMSKEKRKKVEGDLHCQATKMRENHNKASQGQPIWLIYTFQEAIALCEE